MINLTINFKSLAALTCSAIILSACGGGGTPKSPAAGTYSGTFVETAPDAVSGNTSFVVDDKGNLTGGTLSDSTTNSYGHFYGSVDSSQNAAVTFDIAGLSYISAGAFKEEAGGNHIYQALVTGKTSAGAAFSANFTVTKVATVTSG